MAKENSKNVRVLKNSKRVWNFFAYAIMLIIIWIKTDLESMIPNHSIGSGELTQRKVILVIRSFWIKIKGIDLLN